MQGVECIREDFGKVPAVAISDHRQCTLHGAQSGPQLNIQMPLISIRDLVVEYEGRRVLNNLNLDIEAGETMVLLGGSGSLSVSSTRSSGILMNEAYRMGFPRGTRESPGAFSWFLSFAVRY